MASRGGGSLDDPRIWISERTLRGIENKASPLSAGLIKEEILYIIVDNNNNNTNNDNNNKLSHYRPGKFLRAPGG